MVRLALRVAGIVGIVAATGGCVSMRPTVTNFSVDYNRVVADTRNRMILLNIVRAAYREPTYYTAFDNIEGSLSMQTSVSNQISNLAGGDATAFSPTVSGSITNAPTFTIRPLNTDDFTKGMLQPIDQDTIMLFLSQGWRAHVLAPLLVQKVECVYHDTVVAAITNSPDTDEEQSLLPAFGQLDFVVGKDAPNTAYDFTIDATEAMKTVIGGALDKFEIAEHPSDKDPKFTAFTIRAQSGSHLDVLGTGPFGNACRARFADRLSKDPELREQLHLSPENVGAMAVSSRFTTPAREPQLPAGAQIGLNVVFRSPDEIVYYLGERLRATLRGRAPIHDAGDGVLFHVDRDAAGAAAVAVSHRGRRWSIPAVEIGAEPTTADGQPVIDRSLQVISLVNELIAAKTSSKDFSSAPTSVRVR